MGASVAGGFLFAQTVGYIIFGPITDKYIYGFIVITEYKTVE